jgi:Fe-S cluster assembly iron-binding protein IscA
MLRITQSAKEMLLSILEAHPGFDLRLFCDAFGRNTPEIGLSVDRPRARDRRLQVDGLAVYLAEEIKALEGETVIDYFPGRGQGLVLRTAPGCC